MYVIRNGGSAMSPSHDHASKAAADPLRRAMAALDRRALLRRSAGLGLAHAGGRAWLPAVTTRAASAQRDAKTLTIGQVESPSDLDPHSQYDYVSARVNRGAYEGLIQLKGGATDE